MNNLQANNIQQMLDQLCVFIQQKLVADQALIITRFARHYFKYVAYEDIADRQLEDLYGAVLSHWNLALKRTDDAINIHVFNPTIEQQGWHSQHTVIEIVIEDMPFLLQSISMEINRHGYTNHQLIHPVFAVTRDKPGTLLSAEAPGVKEAQKECLIHVEINRQSDAVVMQELQQHLLKVLIDIRAATRDWHACKQKMHDTISSLQELVKPESSQVLTDNISFLKWLLKDHFVFLGYREYQIIKQQGLAGFKTLPGTGLGVLRESIEAIPEQNFLPIKANVYQKYNTPDNLVITKSNNKSTVHRAVFMDYIGIKQFDDEGQIIAEKRFLGLFSSTAYSSEIKHIPLLDSKLSSVMQRSGFEANSHDAKALIFALQSLPRDELFQAGVSNLYECSIGVLRLRERQRVRVFVRHDLYGHFVSVLVFVPRERYHTESRKKIQQILQVTFKGQNIDFSVQLSESILARIHFIIHSTEGCCNEYDLEALEQKIITALSEWRDDLHLELHNYYGEARGNELYEAYSHGFTAAYREDFSARSALLDLKLVERLKEASSSPQCVLYSPLTTTGKKQLRFKIYCSGTQASLSRSLPMLENMGVMVCDERPYGIEKAGVDQVFWIHDFGLMYEDVDEIDLEELKPRFQTAFERCWERQCDNDGFNRLIIEAGLNWQQVIILRAFYYYFRQIGITFSQDYVATTLADNPTVAALLVDLFYIRFDPEQQNREQQFAQTRTQIENVIDAVDSLDEDRILRRFLNLIVAAVRSNYFDNPVDAKGIPYFSIKLHSPEIDKIPAPVPHYEIFVYSTRMEGIHLRGGLVARGGIRWSDRREDFRTEVLGLMKAQMTKNAVIVPTGAKGGFVVKRLHKLQDRVEKQQEVIECYQILIRGLLDLTDNLKADCIIKPAKCICYDTDDVYLVVAADKGTASFSDYANELSKQYGFWLGDAFASGGSSGYDHKVMGITARGGWESVKHHFSRLGIDMQNAAFSVIGIGSMAGDVFGNGLLLSNKIKLLASFDHKSIFFDPDPDPELSFQERKRLFLMPKSSWHDYQADLLSKGGGIFPRNAKSINLTDQMKQVLDVENDHLTPNQLIKAILQIPVDLLWNGGIGTYVKCSDELHMAAGDKSNDSVRVNANQLRCKAVGEGGNLGFTQAGRIEYAQHGGKINTDSIDNSAGVDCSDHEVNIKILLNALVQKGDLTDKQRDELLVQMTDQVADLVLQHNYQQNRAISLIEKQAEMEPLMMQRLIEILENQGGLVRELEYIPGNEQLHERSAAGENLTRPEISVLLAYSKQLLKEKLLQEENFPQENLRQRILPLYFPEILRSKFPDAISEHQLNREILANFLVNNLINRLGLVYPFRLIDEMGVSCSAIVNAYISVHYVLALDPIWQQLEALDKSMQPEFLEQNKNIVRKVLERSMTWFLRREQHEILAAESINNYANGIAALANVLSSLVTEQQRALIDVEVDKLINHGLSADLAVSITHLDILFLGLDVIDIQKRTDSLLQDAAKVFFAVVARLGLSWVRDNILALPKDNMWESLARRSLREELNNICCLLAIDVLTLQKTHNSADEKVTHWFQLKQQPVAHYEKMIKRVSAENKVGFEQITVVLNELRSLLA